MDILNFNIEWGSSVNVLVEIKILDYIKDRSDVDSISVYDMQNHTYLDIREEWREGRGN